MKEMVQLCGDNLKTSRHIHLLCTVLQIGEWLWALLKQAKEDVTVHDDGEQGLQKLETRVSAVFGVE